MAWIDDRIYAHHRVLSVSKAARWEFVAACAYSSGWGTRGHLTRGALEAIGCDRKVLRELVTAGLFAETSDGWMIRGWDEHNERRDDRRERERERKREAAKQWPSRAQRAQLARTSRAAPEEGGAQSARTGREHGASVDGSDGSERENPRAVTSQVDAARATNGQPSDFDIEDIFGPITQEMP